MAQLDRAYRVWLLLILAGAAGLFLVGNGRMPLWDRDEPRYAECSREMLNSGDWVVPRFLGDLRPHKPPFIYWCQATAMELFGPTGAAARLPSAMAVFITAALLAVFVWRFAGARRAVWCTLVFCTSMLVVAAAKMAITDGVLLLWIAIGQGCLFALWRNPSWKIAVLFWISTALAGLTKGPVVLAMHLMTLFVFAFLSEGSWKSRISWWGRLKPIVGIAILVLFVAPWLVMVNNRAPDFLPRLLNRAGKYASSGAEGHAQWPGFYLLLIWGLFFPWSLMLPTAIGMGLRHRKRAILRFAVAAAVGPWIVMELVPNKLPFYVLPSFPALAILTAEGIVRSSCAKPGSRDDDLKKPVVQVASVGWALAVVCFGVGVRWIAGICGGPPGIAWAWAGAGAIYAIIVAGAFMRRRVALASAAMGIGMGVLQLVLFAFVLPSFSLLSTSRDVGNELNRLGAGGNERVAMIDYREPSLAFYQGGGAREIDSTAMSGANPPDWAVLTSDTWMRLPAGVRAGYGRFGPRHPVLIYNDGRQYKDLLIVRKKK